MDGVLQTPGVNSPPFHAFRFPAKKNGFFVDRGKKALLCYVSFS
jgi:hypothetical protein